MADQTVVTEEVSALQEHHVCVNDASEMVWQEMPDFPGIWAWCCPECPNFEF